MEQQQHWEEEGGGREEETAGRERRSIMRSHAEGSDRESLVQASKQKREGEG